MVLIVGIQDAGPAIARVRNTLSDRPKARSVRDGQRVPLKDRFLGYHHGWVRDDRKKKKKKEKRRSSFVVVVKQTTVNGLC